MSAHTRPTPEQPDQPHYPCERDGCDGEYPPQAAVKGSYCSLDCYHRAKGAKALSRIRRDHRFCASCYAKLKDVEMPTDEELRTVDPVTTEAVIGHQHPRPEAAFLVDADGDTPADRIERGRIGCQCGNVDHSTHDATLEHVERERVLTNLLVCLRILAREGSIAARPSKDRLFATLREHGREWDLAIGRAIYD